MKFTEHLSAHITPEWRTRYMNYEEIKHMIKDCTLNNNSTNTYYCEKKIIEFCNDELNKVDTFFLEKISEANRKFVEIKRELKTNKKLNNGKLTKKLKDKLRFTLSEFYLSLILIQNYQKLNYTGFRNILRYYDKAFKINNGKHWLNNVHKSNLFSNNDTNKLIKDVEKMYTNEIENGNYKQALDRLRVPAFKEEYNTWSIFRIGFFLGAFCFLIICEIVIYIEYEYQFNWYHLVPLYRGSFTIILFILLWSINMLMYRKYGINQILIFEIDPRKHIPINDLMEFGAVFAFLWAISILAFFYHKYLNIPMYMPPLMLYVIFIVFLFNPTKTILYTSRIWVLDKLKRLCLAPSYFVMFPEFWIGDQLCSTRPMLLDFKFTFCFILENPTMIDMAFEETSCKYESSYINMLIEILPPWFRMAQVVRRYRDTGAVHPHLYNAVKFLIMIITTIITYICRRTNIDYLETVLNPWYIVMVIFLVINAIFNSYWDLIIDFGVFQIWKGKKIFLRDQLAYPQLLYYISIIEDILIRFQFIILLITDNMVIHHNTLLTTILYIFEIIRRFVWNLFRLENEHFNNCGEYRVHRDISVRAREASLFADDSLDEEFIREDIIDDLLEIVIKDIPKISLRRSIYRSALGGSSGSIVRRDRLLSTKLSKTNLPKKVVIHYVDELMGRTKKDEQISNIKRADDLLLLEYDSDDDF